LLVLWLPWLLPVSAELLVVVVPLVAALAFQGRGRIVVVLALVTAGVGGALVVVVACCFG
jgi:hypothetical protein